MKINQNLLSIAKKQTF